LQAMGWTLGDLEARTGIFVSNLHRISHRQDRVLLHVYERIAAVYDELCMTPGPSSRMRVIAKNKGYVTALAWDDIDVDDAPQVPRPIARTRAPVDEVLVERFLTGDAFAEVNTAERHEVIRRWVTAGRPVIELERRTGWNVARYIRDQNYQGDD
jgi:hypothetical protein